MNTTTTDKQAVYDAARDALIQAIGEQLIAARARQEAARRALHAANAIIRDAHASHPAKEKAQAEQAAAQRDLTAANGDVGRLELEHQQALQGDHPSIVCERFVAQQAHTRERMEAIAAAEAALQAAMRSDAVQGPLRALADLGAPVAQRRVADLLKD
jgi:hypothetical protein